MADQDVRADLPSHTPRDPAILGRAAMFEEYRAGVAGTHQMARPNLEQVLVRCGQCNSAEVATLGPFRRQEAAQRRERAWRGHWNLSSKERLHALPGEPRVRW